MTDKIDGSDAEKMAFAFWSKMDYIFKVAPPYAKKHYSMQKYLKNIPLKHWDVVMQASKEAGFEVTVNELYEHATGLFRPKNDDA